ncbi:unnamed protein product [Menidia menidia]|uniref:Carbohydrate sulfotransferase n=1 Tax=Menidia menidia TaxID=238744 RepID=A0A8S4BV01_9TELE|nr:unnamed protein product [Menidia menidia]
MPTCTCTPKLSDRTRKSAPSSRQRGFSAGSQSLMKYAKYEANSRALCGVQGSSGLWTFMRLPAAEGTHSFSSSSFSSSSSSSSSVWTMSGEQDFGDGAMGVTLTLRLLMHGKAEAGVQAVHQGRRELLEEACSSYTRKRRVLIPEDLKHVVVDDQHGLLYCYVPKVACTNWKRVLMVLTGAAGARTSPLDIPAHEAHVPGTLRTLSEYSAPQINRRLRSYLKFVFVREPFERLVSAYRNKFTRSYNTAFHRRYGTKIVRRHRPDPRPEALETGGDVSFEEFVYYLVDPATRREEPFNEHWERVHSLCHPCLIHYDVVGKYETLEQDSRYVLQLAGVEGQVGFPASPQSARTTGDMAAQKLEIRDTIKSSVLPEGG